MDLLKTCVFSVRRHGNSVSRPSFLTYPYLRVQLLLTFPLLTYFPFLFSIWGLLFTGFPEPTFFEFPNLSLPARCPTF